MRQMNELFEKGLLVLPVEIRGVSQTTFNFVDKKSGKSMVAHNVELALEVKIGTTRIQAKGVIRAPYGSEVVVPVPDWAGFGSLVWLGVSEAERKNQSYVYTVVDAIEMPKVKQG